MMSVFGLIKLIILLRNKFIPAKNISRKISSFAYICANMDEVISSYKIADLQAFGLL
jgi:hypothetical protein